MKQLIVGINSNLTSEQAQLIKDELKRHGIAAIVIANCSALTEVDTDAIGPRWNWDLEKR